MMDIFTPNIWLMLIAVFLALFYFFIPRAAAVLGRPFTCHHTDKPHQTNLEAASQGGLALLPNAQDNNFAGADLEDHCRFKARNVKNAPARHISDSGPSASGVKKVQRFIDVVAAANTMKDLSRFTIEYEDAIDHARVDPSRRERQDSIRDFAALLRKNKLSNKRVAKLTRDIFIRLDSHRGGYVQSTSELMSSFVVSWDGLQYIERSINGPDAIHTDLFVAFLKKYDSHIPAQDYRDDHARVGEGTGSVSINVGQIVNPQAPGISVDDSKETSASLWLKFAESADKVKQGIFGKVWPLREDTTEGAA